ncbi:hypothetical protein GCM10020255_050590 [Rhodococcus baikonurensis]
MFYMSKQEYDIVVVGSGAAGMTAALTAAHQGLSVVIVEKAAHYGGSTARSGGGVWIPNNEALQADGVTDTPEAARSYLHSIIGDVVAPERIDTYLERGPEMLSFVLKNSPLELQWVPGYSDYYPEAPGGRLGGRSVEPTPFDGNKLGADRKNLEPDYVKAPKNFVITQADYKWLNLLMRNPRGPLRAMKVGMRFLAAKATKKDLLVRGQALVAGIRLGLQSAGVPILLNTPLTSCTPKTAQFAASTSSSTARSRSFAPATESCWDPADSSTTRKCVRSTSAHPSAPNGPSARRPTPATASARAKKSALQSISWTTPGGARPFH